MKIDLLREVSNYLSSSAVGRGRLDRLERFVVSEFSPLDVRRKLIVAVVIVKRDDFLRDVAFGVDVGDAVADGVVVDVASKYRFVFRGPTSMLRCGVGGGLAVGSIVLVPLRGWVGCVDVFVGLDGLNGYLCAYPDEFVAVFELLVRWKRGQVVNVLFFAGNTLHVGKDMPITS
jgi:hypothetical protein